MIPTKIYCEAKVSRNFQTYTVGIEGTLENDMEKAQIDVTIRALQARCRKLAKEQIAIDSPTTEVLK